MTSSVDRFHEIPLYTADHRNDRLFHLNTNNVIVVTDREKHLGVICAREPARIIMLAAEHNWPTEVEQSSIELYRRVEHSDTELGVIEVFTTGQIDGFWSAYPFSHVAAHFITLKELADQWNDR